MTGKGGGLRVITRTKESEVEEEIPRIFRFLVYGEKVRDKCFEKGVESSNRVAYVFGDPDYSIFITQHQRQTLAH